MKLRSLRKSVAVVLLLTFLSLSSVSKPAHAVDGATVGWWVGAGFCSLLYTPLKLVGALLLGLGGGLSMIVTVPMDNTEVSENLIKWGIYGDWLIRPDHLQRESTPQYLGFDEEFHFLSETELQIDLAQEEKDLLGWNSEPFFESSLAP